MHDNKLKKAPINSSINGKFHLLQISFNMESPIWPNKNGLPALEIHFFKKSGSS